MRKHAIKLIKNLLIILLRFNNRDEISFQSESTDQVDYGHQLNQITEKRRGHSK